MSALSRANALTSIFSNRSLVRLQATLLALIGFSSAAVPRLLPLLCGLLALAGALHILLNDPKRVLELLRLPIAKLLAAFIIYLFINSIWAADRPLAFATSASVLLVTLAAFLIATSFALRINADARVLAKWSLFGLLLGIGYLLIEFIFDEPIMRFVDNHVVQLFKAGPKNAKIVNGSVVKLHSFILNRNVTSLVMLLASSLFFVLTLETARGRRTAAGLLIFGAVVCVLLSNSGTSTVALFVGVAVLGLAVLSLPVTRYLLAAAWIVATLLTVPLCSLPYTLGWHHWTWLPPSSVAARFYIWRYTADKIHERPITGIGVRNARTLGADNPKDAAGRQEMYVLRPGRHPHNIFLQTWLELGAIGALLLCGVGLAALWHIQHWPPMLEAGGYALFAICSAVGFSGFDLWQTWLIASLALAWASMLLAMRCEPQGSAAFLESHTKEGGAKQLEHFVGVLRRVLGEREM